MKAAFLSCALGLWLIATALTFGFPGLSDIVSGLLLIIFGLLSLKSERIWSKWAIGLVGVWLQFAPLLFWAPEALMYINDTLIGAIAIVLAFISTSRTQEGNSIPTGWSYNPSGWTHRIPTITLAMLCWFFSRYMAAYQLGYIHHIWDPFFPDGTLHVITSSISKQFPVSDAGLGALCYSLEFLLGWQGGADRWHRMPWLVFAFAFLVIPVGIVSIFLIILQPVIVGAWCSWCLATAACMLLMIVLTAGELAAVLQFLYSKKDTLWQTFWKGAQPEFSLASPSIKEMSLGIGLPWNLLASVALGVWTMFSPSVLGLPGKVATANYILGPLIIAASVISLAEAFRAVRYLNILFGILLIVFCSGGMANNIPVGLAILLLSFRKGAVHERYGAWEAFIK